MISPVAKDKQFDLFDCPDVLKAHARRSDPQTSHDAADSISDIELRLRQAAVLKLFEVMGPMEHQRLIAAYTAHGLRLGLPKQSESGIRTRCSELVSLGRVKDSGARVMLPSGRKSIIWTLA